VHVLYLIDSLVPGGAEQSLLAVAPYYVELGIRLDIAYLHDRPGLQVPLEAAGAALFCLAGSGGRPGWIRRMVRLIRQRRPDLVHTTLFEADMVGRTAALIMRTPVVSSLVNPEYGPEQLDDPDLRRWKVRVAQAADALTARWVARFHSVSRYVAEVMAPRLLIPLARIDVVPRGRDRNSLGTRTERRRREARLRLGVPLDVPVILAAARHERQKGLDVLIEAFPSVRASEPEARLLVAGREGESSSEIRAAIDRLGIQESVSLLGPRQDVADLLCMADVFVAPSRWEGLAGVLLEAMALDAPIVATDLAPVRELLGSDAGLLVPPEHPPALAQAIISTLHHPAETRRRVHVALERFLANFTVERVAPRMAEFYERSLKRR
jgi:glycosyltransferase involved in cell wall biosynthesis